MGRINLIQLRDSYSPRIGIGNPWLPVSLLSVQARLDCAGIETKLFDENIGPTKLDTQIYGINHLGAQYIPDGIKKVKEIRDILGEKTIFLVGGQVINGLTDEEIINLYGQNVFNGNIPEKLAEALGINPKSIPILENISLVKILEKISDDQFKEYLERTVPLYDSNNGCRFRCTFCGANSQSDPDSGQVRRINQYLRDPKLVEEELAYLLERAENLGTPKLGFYSTSLDYFQPKRELVYTLKAIQRARTKHSEISVSISALTTLDSFLRLERTDPEIIQMAKKVGLTQIGFGIDGTEESWKDTKKPNTTQKSYDAIRKTREYGFIPEALCVFGFDTDTEDTMKRACAFTEEMIEKHGAIPRPHLFKVIPGSELWRLEKNRDLRKACLEDPENFRKLDFTTLNSELTQPNEERREITNKYYRKMSNQKGATTLWTKPTEPHMSSLEVEEVRKFNEGRFDH